MLKRNLRSKPTRQIKKGKKRNSSKLETSLRFDHYQIGEHLQMKVPNRKKGEKKKKKLKLKINQEPPSGFELSAIFGWTENSF